MLCLNIHTVQCIKYVDSTFLPLTYLIARFVTQNYRQTASVTSLIQNLGWTNLKTRRKNSRLLCMFKILNELVEIPINDRLIPADRRTRGGHNQAYKHIRANTTLGHNSFWHRTIPDWNSLPVSYSEGSPVPRVPLPPICACATMSGTAGICHSYSESSPPGS